MDGDRSGLVRFSQRQYHNAPAPIGTFFHLCLLIGGVAVTISSNVLGPFMGITSVLWLMMRNDPAIDPRVAWMVFGAWSFFGLTWFMVQCNRVYNHRLRLVECHFWPIGRPSAFAVLYIFLSLALASVSLCFVALLQRSSLQSGLVTVIPPCTSFAAYTVAYFFPDKIQEKQDYGV